MNKMVLALSTATLLLGSVTFTMAQARDDGISRSGSGSATQPGASHHELQGHRGDRDTSRTDNTLGTVQQEEMDGD